MTGYTLGEGADIGVVEFGDMAVVAMNQLFEPAVAFDLAEESFDGIGEARILPVVVSPAQLARLADLEGNTQLREKSPLQRNLVGIGDDVVDIAAIDLLDEFFTRGIVNLDPGQTRVQIEFVAQHAAVGRAADYLERAADQIAGMPRALDLVAAVQYLVGHLVVAWTINDRTTEVGFARRQSGGSDIAAAKQ